jgi:hypothetical protein
MVVGVFLWRLNGATERKREGQGGPGSAPHGGQEWGRERGPRVRQGAARAAGIIAARQGRAAGRGDSARERLTGGARWSAAGCGRGEEGEAARQWVLTRGPGQHSAETRFKLGSNRFKKYSTV